MEHKMKITLEINDNDPNQHTVKVESQNAGAMQCVYMLKLAENVLMKKQGQEIPDENPARKEIIHIPKRN